MTLKTTTNVALLLFICTLLFIVHCVSSQTLLKSYSEVQKPVFSNTEDSSDILDLRKQPVYQRLSHNSESSGAIERFGGKSGDQSRPKQFGNVEGILTGPRLRRSVERKFRLKKKKNKKRQKHNKSLGQELRYPLEDRQFYTTQEPPSNQKLCPMWSDQRVILDCSNGLHLGSTCHVRCPPGFKLTAKKRDFRRCRKNKRKRKKKNDGVYPAARVSWTGNDQNFRCVSACDPLVAPSNGQVQCFLPSFDQPLTSTSQSCVVRCDPGYQVSVNSLRSCQSNGTWSGDEVTCDPVLQESPPPIKFKFHQQLNCGDVRSMTTYARDGDMFLVVGDRATNVVRVFRWTQDRFSIEPWQELNHYLPQTVDAVANSGQLFLFVGNGLVTSVYKLNVNTKKLVFSRTISPLGGALKYNSNKTRGIDFLPMYNGIYRCVSSVRNGRSVVMVQKLQKSQGKRAFFKRVVRRKMRQNERVYQCSLFDFGNMLNIIITSNQPGGRGRIWIARPEKKRMKIVDVIKDEKLRNISDLVGFRTMDKEIIIAAQKTGNGRCFVYTGPRPRYIAT